MVDALGGMVLHSFWQGAVLALACAVAGLLPGGTSAALRHATAWVALASLGAACVVTFALGFVPTSYGWLPNVVDGLRQDAPTRLVPWLAYAWMGGAVLAVARLLGGLLLLERTIRRAVVADDRWQRRTRRLGASLGVATVEVRMSEDVDVPLQIGWWRPVIVMPLATLAGLPTAQAEALLAHELAHVRRADYVANLLQSVIEALLFYHPAAWWLGRRIRAERECCCDDLAVVACGGDVITYTRALASLEAARPRPIVALGAADGLLLARVRRLLSSEPPARRPVRVWPPATVAAFASMLLVLGLCVQLPGYGTAIVPPQAAGPDAVAVAASAEHVGPLIEHIEFREGITAEVRAAVRARADLRVGSRFTPEARQRLGRSLGEVQRGLTFTDGPGRWPFTTRVVISPDC